MAQSAGLGQAVLRSNYSALFEDYFMADTSQCHRMTELTWLSLLQC